MESKDGVAPGAVAVRNAARGPGARAALRMMGVLVVGGWTAWVDAAPVGDPSVSSRTAAGSGESREVVTAAGAIEAVAAEKGRPYAESLVQVIGVGGGHQPRVWRVLARDPFRPGAIRDFTVEAGRVVADQFVPPAYHDRVPALVIPAAEIRCDSDAVFHLADRAARAAGVGFDSLDYEIRVLGSGSDERTSLWLVRLNGRGGRTVGEVAFRARDGVLVRQEWFPEGKGVLEEGRYADAPAASGGGGAGTDPAAGRVDSTGTGTTAVGERPAREGEAVRTPFRQAGDSLRRVFGTLFGAGAPDPPPATSIPPAETVVEDPREGGPAPGPAPVGPTRYQ